VRADPFAGKDLGFESAVDASEMVLMEVSIASRQSATLMESHIDTVQYPMLQCRWQAG
jgi:hypothetical protein